MNEDHFLRCNVYAWVSWAVTFLLVAAAWVAMFQQPRSWHLAGLLAFTAAICSAIASVLHVRSYMVRLSSLIRALHPPAESGEKGLRPVG